VDEGALTGLGEIYALTDLSDVPAARGARMLAGLLDLLSADAGFIGTVTPDGKALDVFRVTPFSENIVRLAFPVDAAYPLAYAFRMDRSLFIASNEQLRCDHPGLVRVQAEDHACATVPLHGADGGLVGAINVSYEEPHEFSDDERVLIGAAARRCAAALAFP
jgi:GAF domain-containing protein